MTRLNENVASWSSTTVLFAHLIFFSSQIWVKIKIESLIAVFVKLNPLEKVCLGYNAINMFSFMILHFNHLQICQLFKYASNNFL